MTDAERGDGDYGLDASNVGSGREADSDADQDSSLRVNCPACHEFVSTRPSSDLQRIRCHACDTVFDLVADFVSASKVKAGEYVGRFRLDQLLGRGGFGTVWRAYDPHLDRFVALKIPRYSSLTAAEGEAFLREARAAGQIRHPNVVAIHEVGRDGNQLYLVADLIDGESLEKRLANSAPPIAQVVVWVEKLARALHAVHEAGIVHRDLKPANVLLDKSDEPFLVDFGLALRYENELTLTTDGHILGTSSYLSPEIVKGNAHQADACSDLFSFGIVLYQMLTNELPFRGNHHAVIQAIVEDVPSPPRRLNRLIPRDLEVVCLKCLEKSPSLRFRSAEVLADELGRIRHGQPILTRPASSLRTAVHVAFQRPYQTLLAVLLFVLAIVGPLLAIQQDRLMKESAASKLVAEENERVARKNGHLARRNAYAADLGSVLRHLDEREPSRARILLERHIPGPGEAELRGFEWRYLWKRCHAGLVKTLDVGQPIVRFVISPDETRIGLAQSQTTDGSIERSFSVRSLDSNEVLFRQSCGELVGEFFDRRNGELCFATVGGHVLRIKTEDARVVSLANAFPRYTRTAVPMNERDAILASGDYGELRIHERGAKTPSRVIALPEKMICRGLSLSPDDRRCLVYGVSKGGLRLLGVDIATGRVEWSKKLVASVRSGRLGEFLTANEVISFAGLQSPKIIQIDTGNDTDSFEKPKATRGGWLSLSPERGFLASVDPSLGSAVIWDVQSRSIVAVVPHEDATWGQWLNEDVLVTSGLDGRLRWWSVGEARDGARQKLVDLKFYNFWNAKSSLDGLSILTTSGADRVEEWDLTEKKRIFRFPSKAKHGQAFGPRGSVIAKPIKRRTETCNQLRLAYRDETQSSVVFEQTNPNLKVDEFVTSPSHEWLCVAALPSDPLVAGHDPRDANRAIGLDFVNLLTGEHRNVTTDGITTLRMQFSRDSQQVFRVNSDRQLEARLVDTGEVAWSLPNVFGFEFLDTTEVSDNFLALGGSAGTIQIIDLHRREVFRTLKAAGVVRDIHFLPNEETIVAACGALDDSPEARGEIRFFDLESGQTVLTLGTDLNTCIGMALTDDELQMTTVHFDGKMIVWSGASDDEVERQR